MEKKSNSIKASGGQAASSPGAVSSCYKFIKLKKKKKGKKEAFFFLLEVDVASVHAARASLAGRGDDLQEIPRGAPCLPAEGWRPPGGAGARKKQTIKSQGQARERKKVGEGRKAS